MIPPDFATFWSQAAQQGFKPKIVTIGKALLFPSVIDSLGRSRQRAHQRGLVDPAPPVQVGPHRPERQELTDAYTAATKRPWTQPIGFQHALFEVGDRRAQAHQEPRDPKAILDSIVATNYQLDRRPGELDRQAGEERHQDAAGRRPVAAQGRQVRARHRENKTAPKIPVGGKLALLG